VNAGGRAADAAVEPAIVLRSPASDILPVEISTGRPSVNIFQVTLPGGRRANGISTVQMPMGRLSVGMFQETLPTGRAADEQSPWKTEQGRPAVGILRREIR
jgi:hypothetical protein